MTAVVEDEETPADRLSYEWSAEAGAFTGTGASVTWRAASGVSTPVDQALRLTVVEAYLGLNDAGQIVSKEHRVTGQVSVRVHNSPKELGDMGVKFLNLFADSSVSPEGCLVDFTDTCPGKLDELSDIRNNREFYLIRSHSLGQPAVSVTSPFNSAEMHIACTFESEFRKCPPSVPGCTVGSVVIGSGDCYLTARYEQARWWLCDSRYFAASLTPALKHFFGPNRSFQTPRPR